MAKTTPFKSISEFEAELTTFANKYKIIIHDHSDRISDYFEISCYNMVVKYYEGRGYTMKVCNEKDGKFKYKCSPNGHIQNFSYFSGTKEIGGEVKEQFYLMHNATVQSAHDASVFTTPDIVVSKVCDSEFTNKHYQTKKLLSFIANKNVITFCEAKHFAPFPELMINFIGTVNELKPECLSESGSEDMSLLNHIAPSLMMSGSESKPCLTIRKSLERRYFVNFFDNLIDNPLLGASSLLKINEITTLGKKGAGKVIVSESTDETDYDFAGFEEEGSGEYEDDF